MVRTLNSYSSAKDVAYSCGYCGYALNLSSSTRNTVNIGSKYGKQIRKGVVLFFAIDESRFTQTDEVSCMPYFHSRRSWGFFRKSTQLLCHKCGGHIGNAYEDKDSKLYDDSEHAYELRGQQHIKSKDAIKINALQPSTDLMFLSPCDSNLNCYNVYLFEPGCSTLYWTGNRVNAAPRA